MNEQEKEKLLRDVIALQNEIRLLKHQLSERDHEIIEKERKELQRKREQDWEKKIREREELGLKSVRDYSAWVVYATPWALCGLEPDGTTRFVNPACERLTGYHARQMIGKNWWTLFCPGESFQKVEKLYGEFKKGDVVNYELTLTVKNGQKCIVSLSSINRFDDKGRLAEIILVSIDITARKRAEAALEQSEMKFRTLLSNIPCAVYRCANDEKWTMSHISSHIEEISGYTAWDLIDNRALAYADIIHPEDRELVVKGIAEGLAARLPFIIEYRIRHADGSCRWVYEKGQGCFDDGGNVLWLDGAIFDITNRKLMEQKLEETLEQVKNLSLTDELTALFNRRGFITHAEQQFKVAARNQRPLTIFFADLDGMKGINDTLGHKIGDQALVATANILRTVFRSADIIARLGGDEFAVLSLETDAEMAKRLMEEVQQAISEFNSRPDAVFRLAMSVGVAQYDPNVPTRVEKLLEQADQKMYEVKQSRK